ncbi:glycosyltransferase [uncultured Bacteroides sp.]|uniref:glycosyltransferase n=1 Tax=uncultured Bacteroides sp. TaxID=162156 RepID=UPI002675D1FB|nr:glycosyltransferase [uncultured Bacteroides sp.]
MKNKMSIACLTADLLGGRSFSINYHLFTVINAILENDSVSSIHLYTTSINDCSSCSLIEIQADFHIRFPQSRVFIHEMDSKDILFAGEALSGFDLLICEMFVWGDSVKYARSMRPSIKVIYCVHSILQQELIANAQNKWIGFDHFHRLQREMMGMADCLIFDSEMDREYASRFFPDIIRRSSVIYPVSAPMQGLECTWDITKVSFSRFRLLYAGRWEYRKGIEQLIDCFFHCHTQYGMELVVLSDYFYMENFDRLFLSPDNAAKFKALLDRGAIRLIGWKRDRAEYISFICGQCDSLVVPSLYDPFNIVAYDAVQMGVPVVLSRFCGVSELIPDTYGRVVKANPYDGYDLFKSVEKMYRSLQEREIAPLHAVPYGVVEAGREYNRLINGILGLI